MSDGTYKYMQATVTVTNALPGQKISIVLTPASSSPDNQVNWSIGQPMQPNSSGIQLSAVSGEPVPLNSFSIDGTTIELPSAFRLPAGLFYVASFS